MEWLGPTLKAYDLLPKDAGQGGASTPVKATTDSTKPATPAAADADSDFHVSFDDLLDVVNPLQHFPVIGTIYRAITHDQIKTPEKIVGDTLYGGVWGLASSVADTAFEKLTGRNFGDTVLALLTDHYNDAKPIAIASADQAKLATSTAQPEAASLQTVSMNETALTASLNRSGANGDMTQRALYAYRQATGLPAQVSLSPF